MVRRYRSDPTVMRAGVRSVPRSMPDPKVSARKGAPWVSPCYPPSIWHSADRQAHPGATGVTPLQPHRMVFQQTHDDVEFPGADTNGASPWLNVPWAAPLPATSVDRLTPRILPSHKCSAAGHFALSPADREPVTSSPREVREPFHVRHPTPMPLTPVQRNPRHRAAPASHRTAWVTVAAVAVAFLAGTAMATLDGPTDQASPGKGSSVGSAPLDGPRTGFTLGPLDAAVSNRSPDTQPAFTGANALVAMNSDEATATMQGDNAQGPAGNASTQTARLAGQPSAAPPPRDPAVPRPDETVIRAGTPSPVQPPAVAPAAVPPPGPAPVGAVPSVRPTSAPAPAAAPIPVPAPPPTQTPRPNPAPAPTPNPVPEPEPEPEPEPAPAPAPAPPDDRPGKGNNGNGNNGNGNGNGNNGNGNGNGKNGTDSENG